MKISQLIPMRFVTMMAHMVLLITLLWNREETVRSCVPWEVASPSTHEYRSKDNEMITGFSLGIGFIGIELLGFVSGITMFFPLHSLFSLVAHFIACVSLGYFITDVWDCKMYWWLFFFCSVLPTAFEIFIIFSVVVLKRPL